MLPSKKTIALALALIPALQFVPVTVAQTTTPSPSSYGSEFPDPLHILALVQDGRFDGSTSGTIDSSWTGLSDSERSVLNWADRYEAKGPFSVTNKTVVPPSGDLNDYLSWAPYWWPNCTGVGNTTELTEAEIYVTCPYQSRDGQFVPDRLLVNNIGAADDLADTILYSSLAWAITRNVTYAQRVDDAVNRWFVDLSTRMNPNLNYAQLIRGPRTNGEEIRGSRTGILDLKALVKVTAGIEVLRKGKAEGWTTVVDQGLTRWMREYEGWLRTNDLALAEKASDNNHASFYYAQLAAVQIILQDLPAASDTISQYFAGPFKTQINADGEQPLEAARTRPFHYRCYNLAAMITNARLGAYAGLQNTWNQTSNAGGTIQLACEYTMAIPNPPAQDKDKLGPSVAAIGYELGDDQDDYRGWLDENMPEWESQPFAFWNAKVEEQPRNETTGNTAGGIVSTANDGNTTTAGNVTNSLASNGRKGRNEVSLVAVALVGAGGLMML